MIPDSIPYRETLHDFPENLDDEMTGYDYIAGMGHVRDETFHGWESAAAEKRYWADQKRKDEARAAIGGGFLGAHRL